MRRNLMLGVIVILLIQASPGAIGETRRWTPGSAGTGAAAPSPIEGTWEFSGGSVYVYKVGTNHYRGKVVKATKFSDCVHPKDQVMWDMTGSNYDYTGTHIGFTNDCEELPGWSSDWHVTVAVGEGDQSWLDFCTAPPDSTQRSCLQLDRQIDRYPIIFIHGFLGSEITCRDDVLWPDLPPEFDEMRLDEDGKSNYQNGTACNRNAGSNGKVIKSFAGNDVYGSFLKFLDGLPRKTYSFVYDWRKSPGTHMSRLNHLVNRARSESGYKKVVIVTHSMGGLVGRWYIQDQKHTDKVARVLTLAAPFWGAPSPWLGLSHGWSSAISNTLDKVINDTELKRFSRNLTGGFYLYPSRFYAEQMDGWLTVPRIQQERLSADQVLEAIELFHGTPELEAASLTDHDSFLDWYPDTGVELHMISGTGIKTVSRIYEKMDKSKDPTYDWDNGDGTVPVLSSTAGFSTTYDLGLVTYVCGIGHVAIPGSKAVQKLIKPYLMRGEALGFGNLCDP